MYAQPSYTPSTQWRSRPLYRAVRESVEIGALPPGPENLNRCQEWGAPRVPILAVNGGDEEIEANDHARTQGRTTTNWRSEWSAKVLDDIKNGGVKRVRLLSSIPKDVEEITAEQHHDSTSTTIYNNKNKRRKTDTINANAPILGPCSPP